MPVEIAGFAQALTRCLDFNLVEPPELERVLGEATEPLEMQYTEPSADSPLIAQGRCSPTCSSPSTGPWFHGSTRTRNWKPRS